MLRLTWILLAALGACDQGEQVAGTDPDQRDGGDPEDEAEERDGEGPGREGETGSAAQLAPGAETPRTGTDAPALELANLESGARRSLSSQLGEGTCPEAHLLAFMASWCGICTQSLLTLVELEREHPTLEVVDVVVDDRDAGRQAELRKVRQTGITGPVLVADEAAVATWIGGGSSVPRYYFVDGGGTITGQDQGFGDDVRALMPRQATRALR